MIVCSSFQTIKSIHATTPFLALLSFKSRRFCPPFQISTKNAPLGTTSTKIRNVPRLRDNSFRGSRHISFGSPYLPNRHLQQYPNPCQVRTSEYDVETHLIYFGFEIGPTHQQLCLSRTREDVSVHRPIEGRVTFGSH